MIKVDIRGISDGQTNGSFEVPCCEIDGIFEEFIDAVLIEYTIDKYQNRYQLRAGIKAQAQLLCDLTGEEYTEEIESKIELFIIADTERYLLQKEKNDENDREVFIHEDEFYIDITQEIVEQLAVSLPMKRVSPAYRDKNFEEIYPDFAAHQENIENDDQIDDRWSKLKNLKLN